MALASDPWNIIAYEVRMFSATYEIVLDPVAIAGLPKVLANAVEESAILHTRILCDVFLDKSIGSDDVEISQLFPNWETDPGYDKAKARIGELRGRYGSAQRRGSLCWVFNKLMAHPTVHRGESYDYTGALRILRPLIQNVITEIEALRAKPFTWNW